MCVCMYIYIYMYHEIFLDLYVYDINIDIYIYIMIIYDCNMGTCFIPIEKSVPLNQKFSVVFLGRYKMHWMLSTTLVLPRPGTAPQKKKNILRRVGVFVGFL